MKRTLLLATLLGSLAAAPLHAEEHWAQGVELDKTTRLATGAYTSYKHNSVSGPDSALCWAASAANQIAWWQDRTEENGAIIIPEDCPTGYDVWEEVRTYWVNQGGLPGLALEQWMHGVSKQSQYEANTLSAEGYAAQGFYNRIGGADFHNRYFQFYRNFDVEGALVTNYYISGRNGHDFAGASKYLADGFDNGMMFCFSTTAHAMTVYGVNFNEATGLVDNFYWTDNNNTNDGYPQDRLLFGMASESSTPGTMRVNGADGGRTIWQLYGIRSTGIHFTDYDVHINSQEQDAVFSHYCNLIVDGNQEFELKYDLRDANEEGSPVLPYIYTYRDVLDENGRYNVEVASKEHVTTGSIHLQSGTLSLVDCAEEREKLDGGGSTRGTISFLDSDAEGASRTLKVDRTATIADTIHIGTESGNTLEVTEDHIASFGKLTGKGNLTKTGSGTAEVTEALELDGHVTVQNGYFLLGESATFSDKTTLTVAAAGHVAAKDSESSITLALNSGVHTNDGEMTLTTTVGTGATLKGSGTFGIVTVEGGKLVVGNSPGHQEYAGALTLNSGSIEFAVSGFETASSGSNTGWGSGTYSTINMNGHELLINEDGQICIDLGGSAASGLPDDFCLTLVTGMANTLTDDQLAKLAQQTTFRMSDEDAALTAAARGALVTPQFAYTMSNGALMLTAGAGDNGNVPEPATGTLSLLALAGLMSRRRRK